MSGYTEYVDGKAVLHRYSMMNEWIDFDVTVDVKNEQTASEAIDRGMDAFWDGDFEAYGDCVWNALTDTGIGFSLTFNEVDEDEN